MWSRARQEAGTIVRFLTNGKSRLSLRIGDRDSPVVVVQDHLQQKRFDVVLIGAGIRTIPGNFLLFEKLINVVHAHAPQAKLCFNTKPTDTAEAVQRWL